MAECGFVISGHGASPSGQQSDDGQGFRRAGLLAMLGRPVHRETWKGLS
jgi:hypothetical protein